MESKRIIKTSVIIAVLLLALELTVFNYPSYKLLFGDYEKRTLSLSEATLSGFIINDEGQYVGGVSGTSTVEFTGLDMKIGTIYIDAFTQDTYSTPYRIDFTDETNANYRIRQNLVDGVITDSSEHSKYVNCSFSGRVGSLKIKFTASDNNSVVLPDDGCIRLNESIPPVLSPLRLLFLAFIIYSVYFFFFTGIFRRRVSEGGAGAVTGAVCVVAVLLAFLNSASWSNGFAEDFTSQSGNQITKELVDAFEAGQVSLLRPVEGELLALDNPYDWSERLQKNVKYAWDHVMYEGKYYSYYGIAPVILLFLPYHLLTGWYFPTVWAVFLFGAAGLLFLALFFKRLCEKFFPTVTLGMFSAALIMLLISCGVWFCFATPNFYEIAQNSGFAFVCAGAYFLLSSNVAGEGEISRVRLCLSSALLATAVLCRPTTAVWCAAALPFIFLGLAKLRASLRPGERRGVKTLSYLLCSLLPFAVIGGVQMIYNYARFGSFTDFGIQYSLTINDFTRAGFSVETALIGFYNFLLAVPVVRPEFPYVFSGFSDLGVNGYYYIANRIAAGQFFRVPLTFSYFALPLALAGQTGRVRLRYTLLFLLCCVVLPCAVIFSIWESGYGVRYCVDFSWQMTAGATAIYFALYRRATVEQVRGIMRFALAASFVLCICVNLPLIISYIGTANGGELVAVLGEEFDFWK